MKPKISSLSVWIITNNIVFSSNNSDNLLEENSNVSYWIKEYLGFTFFKNAGELLYGDPWWAIFITSDSIFSFNNVSSISLVVSPVNRKL